MGGWRLSDDVRESRDDGGVGGSTSNSCPALPAPPLRNRPSHARVGCVVKVTSPTDRLRACGEMGFSAMLGCLLISNSTNLALLWPVSKRAHLLIVMVFRCARALKGKAFVRRTLCFCAAAAG